MKGSDFFDNFNDPLLAAGAIIRILLKKCGGTATISETDLQEAIDHHLLHRGEKTRFHISLGKKCTDPTCAHRGIERRRREPPNPNGEEPT